VQKEAALENACVFWDLFEAMGGNNSMPSWVLREEPLANKDFIHFNNKGAEFVGKMFLNSLFKELEKRKAANNTTKILSN
jgi:lysophospholipase L1-like esterase